MKIEVLRTTLLPGHLLGKVESPSFSVREFVGSIVAAANPDFAFDSSFDSSLGITTKGKMNRCHSLRPVYVSDSWHYFHGASKEHSYATATLSDLMASVSSRRLTNTELVHMYMQRRRICRGTRGLKGYEHSPLKRFPADEVIGFSKSTGVANGKTVKEALSKAKQADELYEEMDKVEMQCSEVKAKIVGVRTLSSSVATARLVELEEQLASLKLEIERLKNAWGHLRGAVFDAKTILPVKSLAEKLEMEGAIHYGTTAENSSDTLPHPYHPAIPVETSGGGALAVALGLSTFSLGTDCRMDAGLFGLSGFYHGDQYNDTIKRASLGAIARTPLDNALIVNAIQGAPESISNVMERFRQPPGDDIRIGYMSAFAPELDGKTSTYNHAAFDGKYLGPMPLHLSVKGAFDVAVATLHKSGVVPHIANADNVVPEISDTFFAHDGMVGGRTKAWDARNVVAATNCLSAAAPKTTAEERNVLQTSPLFSDRQVEHAAKVSEALKTTECLLTPLLRIPYWKSFEQTLCKSTNRVAPTRAMLSPAPCGGMYDPSCSPYLVLANHWGTPSVTIPFSVNAPHPIRDEWQTMPSALLLTMMPAAHAEHKKAGRCSLMELLFVAHKLSIALRDYHPLPPYIKELWELSGEATEDMRVTWPTDFETCE